MPYTRVPDPNLNSDKPARSADIKQIRDNQDFFDAQLTGVIIAAGISKQSINDDFMSTLGATGIGSWWDITEDTTANTTVISQHTLRCDANGTTVAFYAGVAAAADRQRIVKTEEYVAYMECRIKRAGSDSDSYFVGWQDIAHIGTSSQYSDVTDCVGVVRDSGGNWIARAANASGGTSTVGPFATATNWNVVKLVFTCSATAGSRKVEVYLNSVLQGTMATDANIPSVRLVPVLGVRGSGSGTPLLHVDYAIFTIDARPLAA